MYLLDRRLAEFHLEGKTLKFGRVVSVKTPKEEDRWYSLKFGIRWDHDGNIIDNYTVNYVHKCVYNYDNIEKIFKLTQTHKEKSREGMWKSVNLIKNPPKKKGLLFYEKGHVKCPPNEKGETHDADLVPVVTDSESDGSSNRYQDIEEENCYLAYDDVCILKDNYNKYYGKQFNVDKMIRTADKLCKLNMNRMDPKEYDFNPKSHPLFYNQKFLYLKQVCRSVKSKDGKANVTVALSCKTCPSFYRNDSKKINRITTVCIACYEHFLKFHGGQKQLLQLNDAMTPRAGRVTRRRVLSQNTSP